MTFTPDPSACITPMELNNRDATYMVVSFKHTNTERGNVFGKATSSGGYHAEEHFDRWCRAPENLRTLGSAVARGGNIIELLLSKSPCGTADRNCAATLIALAGFLNAPNIGVDHLNVVLLGMHRGIHDAASGAAMQALSDAQPLLRLYAWDPGDDPFSATDQILRDNIQRFDNSANVRRGTDVATRLQQVTQYMHDGLGLRHVHQGSDHESQGSDADDD